MQHGRLLTLYHLVCLGTYHHVICPSSHTLSEGPVCHARKNSVFRIELDRKRRDFAGPISHRYNKSLACVYQIQLWDIQAKVSLCLPKSCPSDKRDEKNFQKIRSLCCFNKDSILLKLENLAKITSEIDDGKCSSNDMNTVN